ncbi:MAG: hypothetical protein P1U77_24030 [Rubripirellula sp.]|nr:hypothetical protein [Rubripirellula sp.]
MRHLLSLLFAFAFIPAIGYAATRTDQVEAAAKNGKYTYVMFYRANDAATQRMASTIRSQVTENEEKTTWVTVNVRDRKEASLVKRFDASRIPLPAVFGVAPNGAVTGVFRQKVDQAQLTQAILTPKYADMVKALQNQQIAVVCLMPTADTPIPAGVTTLQQNPEFKGKLHRVTAYATEVAEAGFFQRMQVDPTLGAPAVLMFAPPGTHLGTFDAAVSGEELAQELHKSGKCNCSKCQKK